MFGSVLVSVISLMHIYVFWRGYSVAALKHHVSRKALIEAGLALWAAFLCGRFFGHGGTGSLSQTLETFGMTWMGMLFLIFVTLFATDLITGFGLLLPRLAPSLRGFALAVAGVFEVVDNLSGGVRVKVHLIRC